MIRTPNVPPIISPVMNITAPIFVFPFYVLILILLRGFRGMHLTSLSFVPKRRCLRIDDIPTFSHTGDFALPAEKRKQLVAQAVKVMCYHV